MGGLLSCTRTPVDTLQSLEGDHTQEEAPQCISSQDEVQEVPENPLASKEFLVKFVDDSETAPSDAAAFKETFGGTTTKEAFGAASAKDAFRESSVQNGVAYSPENDESQEDSSTKEYPTANSESTTEEAAVASVPPVFSQRESPTNSSVSKFGRSRSFVERQTAYENLRSQRTFPRGTVRKKYKFGDTLGTGGFAVVKRAVDREDQTEYAIKIMILNQSDEERAHNPNSTRSPQTLEEIRARERAAETLIFKEIELLQDMNHPNVVRLKEYFVENRKVYLITELLTGGELLDAVLERGSYSEYDACLAFIQLAEGIKYLHSKNVVHRDLKLENLLLATPKAFTNIKIVDFGLAKKAAEMNMETVCGTPQYIAPEVILKSPDTAYTSAVDMWSAGIVLFILLGGYPPFYHEEDAQLFEKIRNINYNFNDVVWRDISAEAKDLISKLLVKEPEKRFTAAQALQHPWCLGGKLDKPNSRGRRPSEVRLDITKLNLEKHFRRKLKAAVHAMKATRRMSCHLASIMAGPTLRGSLLEEEKEDSVPGELSLAKVSSNLKKQITVAEVDADAVSVPPGAPLPPNTPLSLANMAQNLKMMQGGSSLDVRRSAAVNRANSRSPAPDRYPRYSRDASEMPPGSVRESPRHCASVSKRPEREASLQSWPVDNEAGPSSPETLNFGHLEDDDVSTIPLPGCRDEELSAPSELSVVQLSAPGTPIK